MNLLYLPISPDSSPKDAKLVLLTPAVRDTSIVELPPISGVDAENAAKLMARSHYPGDAGGISVAAGTYLAGGKAAALLHIVSNEAISKELETQACVAAPHDFLALSKKETSFAIFVMPGWIEWLAFAEGLPARSGCLRAEVVAHGLKEVMAEVPDPKRVIAIWTSEALENETAEALVPFADSHPFLILATYETHAQRLLASGLNSFGPRNIRHRTLLRSALILLLAADLILGASLLARNSVVETRKYDDLKRERATLLKSAAELSKLKRQLGSGESSGKAANSGADAYALLQTIVGSTPGDVIFTSVDIESPSFHLAGLTRDAFGLVASLQKSDRIANVTLEQATPDESGMLFKFSLSGSLRDDK